MNKADLRERTRVISGFEMAATRSDPEIDDVNNDAYLAVCDLEEWPFKLGSDTFNTVSGTAVYDLDSELTVAIEHPRTVTLEETGEHPVPLEQVTQRYVDRAVDSDSTDEPRVYARQGESKIVLAPTPGAVYTVQVRGWLSVSSLSDDTDAPVFKDRFHPMVSYFAAATLLDEEGRFEEAQRLERRGSQFLNRMRDNYLTSHDDTPVVLGSRSRPRATRGPDQLWFF